MKESRGLVVVAFLIVLSLLAASCTDAAAVESGRPVCVEMFDVSGSVNSERIVEHYLSEAEEVIDHCASIDAHYVADVIDDKPQAALETLRVDLRPEDLRGNALYDNAARRRLSRHTLDAVRAMLSADFDDVRQTNVLAAIAVAARSFSSHKNSDAGFLVLHTDAIHTVGPWNLRKVQLHKAGRARLANELASNDMIPSLSGVRVYVTGANVSRRQRLSDQRLRRIEQFWRLYFERSDAELESYSKSLVFP